MENVCCSEAFWLACTSSLLQLHLSLAHHVRGVCIALRTVVDPARDERPIDIGMRRTTEDRTLRAAGEASGAVDNDSMLQCHCRDTVKVSNAREHSLWLEETLRYVNISADLAFTYTLTVANVHVALELRHMICTNHNVACGVLLLSLFLALSPFVSLCLSVCLSLGSASSVSSSQILLYIWHQTHLARVILTPSCIDRVNAAAKWRVTSWRW